MRNLKKIVAVLCVVAMMASIAIVPALAAGFANEAQATTLNTLGVMAGMNLGDEVTRIQGLTFAIKAAGKDKAAQDLTQAEVDAALANVNDAADIPAWGQKYAAYAVINGMTTGVDASIAPKIKFAPLQAISGDSFLVWTLKSMGYTTVGTANAWETAVTDAKVLTLSQGYTVHGAAKLIRDDVAGILYGALDNGVCKDGKTFVDTLIAAGMFTQQQAADAGLATPPAPLTLGVSSVTALNLKQVQIVYNMTVDKTEAEKIGNYRAYNGGASTDLAAGGSVALQADEKTVIVTLGTAFNNGTTAKVEVKNLCTYSNDAVAAADITVPTVVGVTVTGPKTVTVEYSEPVQNLNANEYTVDDGNYIVTGVPANGSNKVDVTVGVNFANGTHKIKINGTNVTDYAGYKVITRTIEFTVAADTTAPTVAIKSASPTQIKLVFSKPVTNVANANVLYRHTYNDAIYQYAGDVADVDAVAAGAQPFVTVNSSTEITLDWSQKIIPLGNTTFYVTYSSDSGTKIQDLWGNKLAATSMPITITLDTTKPTVTGVEFVDAQTLKVKFSETLDLATAEDEGNYTIKDSAAKAISVASATRGGTDNNEVTLGFAADALGGGSYTVTVKGVKDNALVKNAMDEYTTTLSVTDQVKPTVKDASWSGVGTQELKVYIPFSEQMNTASLTKANFLKNVDVGAGLPGLVPLGSDDSIAIAADGKSVTLTIKTSANVVDLAMRIGAVTDLAGNGLSGIVCNSVAAGAVAGEFNLAQDAMSIKSVEATAKNTLKVTFNGRLSSVSATGFALWDKAAAGSLLATNLSVTSHSINSDGNSEVIFTLGTDLNEAAQATNDLVQLVITGATGTKSYLGTQIANAAYADAATAARDAADKIVPTVSSVVRTSATVITITFNETIEAGTLAATLNGFSVSGGDAKLTSVAMSGGAGVDGTQIVLTGENFVADSTKVSYNNVAGVTDLAGNKVDSFTDKVAD